MEELLHQPSDDPPIRRTGWGSQWSEDVKNSIRIKFKAYERAVHHKPVVLILPICWIVVAITVGIWGLHHAADDDVSLTKGSAAYRVEGVLDSFKYNVIQALVLANEMARAIKLQPTLPGVLASWESLAADVWKQPPPGSLHIRAVYQATCVAVFPHTPVNDAYLGLSSLPSPASAYNVTLSGPLRVQDQAQVSLHVPILISNVAKNETWGSAIKPTACPADCGNTTNSKWWGSVDLQLDINEMFELDDEHEMRSDDFELQLTRQERGQPESLVWTTRQDLCLSNDECAQDAVRVSIEIFDSQFTLQMWRNTGWTPRYLKPLIALVVVLSLAVAVLIFLGLVTWSEHHAMIHCLLPDTAVQRLRQNVWDEELSVHINDLQQETPANHMLDMIKNMQAGNMPSLRQMITVQQALHKGRDVYIPLAEDVGERMQAAEYMDVEVRHALMRQLVGLDALHDNGEVKKAGSMQRSSTLAEKKQDGTRSRARSGIWSSNAAYSEYEIGVESLEMMDHMDHLDNAVTEVHGCALGTVDENEQAHSATRIHARVLTCSTCKTAINPALQTWAEQLIGTDVFPSLVDAFGHLMRPECQAAVSESGAADEQQGKHSDSGSSFTCEPSGENGHLVIGMLKSTSHVDALGDMCTGTGWARSSAGRRTASICRVPTIRIERVLSKADRWGFDAFRLDEVTHGHSLSVLGFWVLHKSQLIRELGLHEVRLARFLRAVEAAYPDNPYHNRRHAADVLQKMFVLLTSGGVGAGYTDPLSSLACYMAAIVHDVEHVGRTNDYLVNTHHPLAIRYNDRSPMENHHLAAAWQILRKPDQNFLAGLPAADSTKLRKLVIELVLATDMKSHFAIIGQFQAQHPTPSSHNNAGTSANAPTDSVSMALHKLAHNWSGSGSQTSMKSGPLDAPVPVSETERLLGLQMVIKCCDLGHLAAPLPVHLKWVSSLEAEFFLQGDTERLQGLPISPLCDRTKEGVTKSQVGFFDFVVLPLVSLFVSRFTSARPLLKAVTANYAYWTKSKSSSDRDRRTTDTSLQRISHSPAP